MKGLTVHQVSLVRADIRQQGVEIRELEEDLLDHICCAMEAEMGSGLPFDELYRQVRAVVFPEGYRTIQQTTNDLLTLKYLNMKKAMNILGTVGSALLLLGSLMKLQKFVGSNETILLGTAALVLGYLPLMLVFHLKNTDTLRGIVRNISGYLGATMIVTGVFCRVLHLPYGKEQLLVGFAVLLLVFVPLFFMTLGREAVMKIHPATSSVLLVFVITIFFAFNSRQTSNAYKESLVMLYEDTQADYLSKRQRLESVKGLNPSAETREALKYIEGLKSYLVELTNEGNKAGLGPDKAMEMNEDFWDVLVYNKGAHKWNGDQLYQLLEASIDRIKQASPGVETSILKTEEGKSWTETQFMHKPVFMALTRLSYFQLELTNMELEVMNIELKKQAGLTDGQ